ncbi:hypothetical protein GC163_19650 [bacterium]|nr:hypothetical protein [bacterium]
MSLSHGIALSLVAVAVFIEWITGKIPNKLSLAGVAGGLVMGAVEHRFLDHLLGFLVVAMIAVVLFVWSLFPGGAAKLQMAVAALIGQRGGLTILVTFLAVYLSIRGSVAILSLVFPLKQSDQETPFPRSMPSSPITFIGLIVWQVSLVMFP